MDTFEYPILPLIAAAVFFAGLFYVRTLTERALDFLSAEEKGLWIDGMRVTRKKMFYVVMLVMFVFIGLMVLGSKAPWYWEWQEYILFAYFGIILGAMIWSHFKSIQYLKENQFSEEAIGLLTKAFWVRTLIYVVPIALVAWGYGIFR